MGEHSTREALGLQKRLAVPRRNLLIFLLIAVGPIPQLW